MSKLLIAVAVLFFLYEKNKSTASAAGTLSAQTQAITPMNSTGSASVGGSLAKGIQSVLSTFTMPSTPVRNYAGDVISTTPQRISILGRTPQRLGITRSAF